MADPISDPTIVPISPAVAEALNEGARKDDEAPSAREEDPTPGQRPGSNDSGDAEPAAAAVPRQPGAQPKDGQQPFTLADIRVGNKDGRGVPITQIYAAESRKYAIYQAGEVMVHFADDPEKEQAQRKAILPVSSARAEVNSLVQGLACREICDRQLAYALQLALDDDIDGAKRTVAAAKAFVLAKRAARGRFQYLKWSYGVAVILTGLLVLASWLHPFPEPSSNLWLAAKAGLVGAAFSIALAIRGRTVALDTDLLDNVTDGTLRLLIGVISAGVLLLLLACGILPSLKIGEANFSGGSLTWQMVLVIGFVGGFLERLVPDLLEKKNGQGNGTTAGAGAPTPSSP
jgi:hypothetical protein